MTGAAVPRFSRREIAAFTRSILRAIRSKNPISVAFVDDETMTALNRKFRRKNRTTDVLTFEDEIVISLDQARRQAKTEKHSLATEVRYLLIHGVLHAHGYDHETDDGEMNALELDVRDRLLPPHR